MDGTQMKKYFLLLSCFVILISTLGYCQNDSLGRNKPSQEISFGTSMLPLLCPTISNGRINNGKLPGLGVERSLFNTAAIDLNYRFVRNENKYRLGILVASSAKSYENFSYAFVTAGANVRSLNKKRTISLNCDLLTGYLQYSDWAIGGVMLSHKFYTQAQLFVLGVDLGITAQYNISKRWFFEHETYILLYGASGKAYYGSGSENVSMIAFTFSKLLGLNLGYRF
jgi:hypothetical protein